MTRRIINTNTGDATHFGSIDGIDYINKLLTGIDQSSTDPVDINTKWTFKDQKLQIANPANTKTYTIATTAISADRNIALPLITLNDYFVMTAAPQTITGKTIALTGTNPNIIKDISLYPTACRRSGVWQGGSQTTGLGFVSGVITGTGTVTQLLSATDGKYMNQATTTSNNAKAGQVGASGSGISGELYGRFVCKFRLGANSSTNTRLYIGVHSTANTNLTTDDPLLNVSGILLGLRAADTNWQIAYNEGTGSTNFLDTTVARNATINTIELVAPTAGTSWQWSLNGSALSNTGLTGAQLPAATTTLYPVVQIENASAGTARNLEVWWWYVEVTEPTI